MTQHGEMGGGNLEGRVRVQLSLPEIYWKGGDGHNFPMLYTLRYLSLICIWFLNNNIVAIKNVHLPSEV